MKPSSSQTERLTGPLAIVTSLLEPETAGRLILQALDTKPRFSDFQRLAVALAAVSGRQDPYESGRVCGEALRLLTDAMLLEESSEVHTGS